MSDQVFGVIVSALAITWAPIIQLWLVIFIALSILLSILLMVGLAIRQGLSSYM